MQNKSQTLAPLVRRLSLHTHFDAEDEAALLALPHTERNLEPGQYIVREGDRPTHSCMVVSGLAVRHKVVGSGGRQIVNVHLSGDMVDLQNSLLQISDHNVQALGRMTAAFIPRESLVELAFSRPNVGKGLWIETLIEGSISREWIANVGRRDAVTRVAHLLCEFAYRLDAVGIGPECNYELPMTQEQLADALGLTSVHINRTLQTLDKSGLTQRTRRSVVITNLEKLAHLGDFNSTYLHLPQSALPEHMQARTPGSFRSR